MLRERTTIDIIQNNNTYTTDRTGTLGEFGLPQKRDKLISFNFSKEWEYSSSWENLSSTGKVVLPRHITISYSKQTQNKNYLSTLINSDPLLYTETQKKIINMYKVDKDSKTNLYALNYNLSDLFRRGDAIIINSYYEYWDKDLNIKETETSKIIKGFITSFKIEENSITLEFEDSMYLLKKIPMPNYTFPKNVDIRGKLSQIITDGLPNVFNAPENIINIIIQSTNNDFTNKNSKNQVIINGDIQNISENYETITFDGAIVTSEQETVAQFLQRLKKELYVKSFFRGYILYITYFPYDYRLQDTIPIKGEFIFQNNIISDDLTYRLKDDVELSALVHNTIMEDTGKTNKDGTKKLKKNRIEILIFNKKGRWDYKSIKKGETVPANLGGERREFVFLDAKTEEELFDRGKAELSLYYYNGFKGSFKTFGTPHIKEGDVVSIKYPLYKVKPLQNGKPKTDTTFINDGSVEIINLNSNIVNPITKDKEGLYFVKGVKYSGGINGYRQEIELDFRLIDKKNYKNENIINE